MRRLTVPVLLLLALGAMAFAVAACGSSNDDAEQVLKDTFSGGKSVKSGKLDIAVNFSGKTAGSTSNQPIAVQITGPFQSRGKGLVPALDLDATIGGGAGGKSVGIVSTGTQGFVTIGETAYVLPPAIFNRFKQSFAQAASKNKTNANKNTFNSLGIQPLNWLKDPQVEDNESIGGVDTKHVSAGVDVPKFLDDVEKVVKKAAPASGGQIPNTTFTPAQKKQIADSIKNARFDVWSGKDDKIIRKLAVSLDFDTPKGKTAPQGISSGSLDFSVTLTDINKPQTITAPANPKPFAELQSQIQGLLGQLQGGSGGSGGSGGGTGGNGGSGSGGSGSGGSGGGTGNSAYVDCIAKAGGDIAKAQKCADLLNP